jgi:hypothetical protein
LVEFRKVVRFSYSQPIAAAESLGHVSRREPVHAPLGITAMLLPSTKQGKKDTAF